MVLTLSMNAEAAAQKHRHTPRVEQVDSTKNTKDAIEAFSDTTKNAEDAEDDAYIAKSNVRIYSDDDVKGVFEQVFGGHEAEIFPAIAIVLGILFILFVLFPIIIIIGVVFIINRRRKERLKIAQMAMDKGQPIPDHLFKEEAVETTNDYQSGVRQIFTNLLNNAVKYTEKGSVSLKIRGKKQDNGMLNLTIVVWDTGIGIKPEEKEMLFTRFHRLDMERNSTVEGTGLGLTIAHHLISLMGGSIDVESEYGKGSIFTVVIPQKIISDEPIGDFQTRLKENLPGDIPYRESFRAPDATILIVDDTRINLTVAVNLLKNTKMKIDTATSGVEAVEMASKTRYDMIFMDQRMPEMTGTEAFHRIRDTADGLSKDVPVICLTADAVIGAKDHYLSEGFSDYLTKPIDNFALEKMLMKYLPEDKVEHVTEELTDLSGSEGAEAEYFATLRSVGIEPKTGLKFCQDDEVFYRSMLAEYAYGELEKAHNLQKSFDTENWHDYSIYVHSLKSSSRMVGATALSMRAAKLETAANAVDSGTIITEHDSMMEEYELMTAVIRSVIPKSALDPDNDDIKEFSPSDDIMEFLPGGEYEE